MINFAGLFHKELFNKYIHVTLKQNKLTPELMPAVTPGFGVIPGITPSLIKIKTPPTGPKPYISVSFNIKGNSTVDHLVLKLYNYYGDIDIRKITHIGVEMGYFGQGISINIGNPLGTKQLAGENYEIYRPSPAPNSPLVINALLADLNSLFSTPKKLVNTSFTPGAIGSITVNLSSLLLYWSNLLFAPIGRVKYIPNLAFFASWMTKPITLRASTETYRSVESFMDYCRQILDNTAQNYSLPALSLSLSDDGLVVSQHPYNPSLLFPNMGDFTTQTILDQVNSVVCSGPTIDITCPYNPYLIVENAMQNFLLSSRFVTSRFYISILPELFSAGYVSCQPINTSVEFDTYNTNVMRIHAAIVGPT